MNNTYRLIWNEIANTWIAVAENVKGRGKRSAGAVLLTAVAGAALAQGVSTQQLPTGGQIVSGSGSISAQGAAMTVNQNTTRMIANWSSFNIGANASVNFVQPSKSAVALNRIQAQDPSQILGRLTANGQVMLVNPAGVMFGQGSQVDVGSLVASSLAISDANFMSGNYRFSNESGTPSGTVSNQGRISTSNGGTVAFLAPVVKNQGQIETPRGSTLLAAAQDITVDFGGDGLINYRVNSGAAGALVENSGSVSADGGVAVLSAQSVDSVTQGVVNNTGLVRAQRLENKDGRIVLEGHALVQTGTVLASDISAKVDNAITSGIWDASADSNGAAQGGRISIQATGHIEQTATGRMSVDGGQGLGGSVQLSSTDSVWVSGKVSADGSQGGNVTIEAPNIVLAEAKVSATGHMGDGGNLRIGGGFQGKDSDIVNAQTTKVMASEFDVSVSQTGSAGQVIVWSESETVFGGVVKATGGQNGGNGGFVEVSSHDKLTFAGKVDATAAAGVNGRLLLDPKNIEIVSAVSSVQVLPLLDPTPSGNEYCFDTTYGCNIASASTLAMEITNAGVSTNRIAIRSPLDSTVATNAGAVRIYNSQTGALISTLTGSSAYDYVGTGFVQLGNGNLVVRSQAWGGNTSNLNPTNVTTGLGAVTFMSGINGLTATVSSANSLVGSTSGDRVGYNGVNVVGVAVLTNGNYVVSTPNWSNNGLTKAGAVTWGSGTVGISGEISSSNSLVGASSYDRIGSGLDSTTTTSSTSQAVSKGITVLNNGNYVVTSPYWNSGSNSSTGMGAVTWGSGTTGTVGQVDATNSLVGSSTTHLVGLRGVTALSNGNYVVVSSEWDNGALANVGAVTWGNGTGGTVGAVSSSNSLIGEKAYTYLGGLYTSTSNTTTDYMFSGITELAGGQYFVLTSPNWNTNATTTATSAGNMKKGSVTRLSANSSTVKDTFGWINSGNSLVGNFEGDFIGRGYDDKNGVVALTNNNTFVVASPYWNNGVALNNVGAVTWVGSTGLNGQVSTSNSLYGTTSQDRVGSGGVFALPNGNYVVSSKSWNAVAGAVTWGNGATGTTGAVNSTNSLIGSAASDQVGESILVLNNGNYVVGSPWWDNAGVNSAGAVTWGNGSTAGSRTVGAIDATNSLVGVTANDKVGSTVYAIPQSSTTSNYVALSPNWTRNLAIDIGTSAGSGTVANAGAATWGSGTTGVIGAVSISNSLIGSTASDNVGNVSSNGYSFFKALSNGNYVLATPNWDRGSLANAGAVTWGSGSSGVSGEISNSNSLLGVLANDKIGSYGLEALLSGNYLVYSPTRITTGTNMGGAVTWGIPTGTFGDVSYGNSLLGSGTFSSNAEQLGSGRAIVLSDGRALVMTNFGKVGTTSLAGRFDILSYMLPPTLGDAAVYAANSSSSQQVGALDIKASMDAGTPVVLQANNDITVSTAITGTNSAGHLTLQAGRSILVNANITTGGANLTLKANESLAAGVVDGQRDAGAASINMASGTIINAGTGSVSMTLGSGAGLTNNASGDITLRTVTGSTVSVVNAGTTSGSSINTNNLITASNSLRLEADYGNVTLASSNVLQGGGTTVIQARDDINVNSAMTAPTNSSNSLSMLAGRSVLINQAIDNKNGPITIKANYADSTDSVSDIRSTGNAVITAAVTTGTVSAGTGAVDVRVMNGSGLTTLDSSTVTSDAITLRSVAGGDVTVINDGPTLGTSSISSPSSTIAAKGNVMLKANKGSISVTGVTTDGTVTPGASITMLAMDDITNGTRAITNTASNGVVTLKAGRSVTLTHNIATPSDVTISANTPYDASSGVSASRTAGAASLSITGTVRSTDSANPSFTNGNLSITLANGSGLADTTTGQMSLAAVFGRNVNILHNGTSGTGITLNGGITSYGLYDIGTNALISIGETNVVANYGSISATLGSYQGSGGNTVVFRARDDISLNYALVDRTVTLGTDPAGLMQLLAGRSVTLNSEFKSLGSPLTVKANYFDNTSTVSSIRLPGDAAITMGGSFGSIRATNGDVNLAVMDGSGLTTTDSSSITSGNITIREIPNAGNVTVTNNGTTSGSGVIIGAAGVGVASTTGLTGTGRTGLVTGAINISTINGDITLQGNLATTNNAAGAITLKAGSAITAPTVPGGEIVLAGTGTRSLTTGTGGSALMFAGSSSGSTGLSALATAANTYYNVDPTHMPSSGVTTGIYALFRQDTMPLTITIANASMNYGDVYPTFPSYSITSGTLNTGDSISSIAWGSAATAYKAQGTYPYSTTNLVIPTFTCNGGGVTCVSNYSLTFANSLTINRRPITITADTKNMTYGGVEPSLTYQITAGNVVNNDPVSGALSRASGLHADTYAISQNTLSYGNNYQITYVPANLTIDPAVLTVSLTNTGVTKTYDGSYQAPLGFTPNFAVTGQLPGDTVSIFYSAAGYNDPHVLAANKVTTSPLSISGVTGTHGSLATDYVLSATSAFVPATITPATLTVSNANIVGTLSKVYDGTNVAAGASLSGSISGAISGDTLSFGTNGMTLAYNSPRVVGATTISASGTPSLVIDSTTSGSLASDYSFTPPVIADVSGTITAKALMPSASIGGTLTKTYDGTTAAPAANVTGSVTGSISGDTLSVDTSGVSLAYNNAHVVGASTISATGNAALVIGSSTAGSVATDYSYAAPTIASVNASIGPKVLLASLTNTDVSKPFDGTNTPPLGFLPQFAVSGFVAGDTSATLSGNAAFNSPDPLTASAVVVSSLNIDAIAGSIGSRTSDYRLDALEKSVAAKIIQLPPALPPEPQSKATTTNAAVASTPEVSKDKELAVAAVASTVASIAVPQIKTSAVLSIGSSDVNVELVVTPVASSLTLAESPAADGKAADDGTVKTSSVGLFTQTGTEVAAGGALSIVEQGRSIRASTANNAASQPIPSNLNLSSMRFVNVDYRLPSGGQNQMTVGVSSDGVLVIKVPAAMKAASDDRSLALIGMATAKERLDVQPANVKGVVIQVEGPSGS